MNYPAANRKVSTGRSRLKGKASFEELKPHWGIKAAELLWRTQMFRPYTTSRTLK
jgi:hypothetical protein